MTTRIVSLDTLIATDAATDEDAIAQAKSEILEALLAREGREGLNLQFIIVDSWEDD